ncbi:unnamed protein product [Allacma fusca]|uniref:Evasin n=1 Tax=Allacma fusca TaxID=39272 RepID=A0A8J2PAZ6_9HEXA|nr:unnamed protein product [Allacma fusca]
MFRDFEIRLLFLLGTVALISVESKPAADPIVLNDGKGHPANSVGPFPDKNMRKNPSDSERLQIFQNIVNDETNRSSVSIMESTSAPPAITTANVTATEAPEEVTITVFAYSNHVEPKMDYKVTLGDRCVDLQRRWLKRVSSVDTHGNCIRMCQYKDCKGSCILVEPGTPYHNRLRILNFDKKTSSLRRC